MKLKEELEEIKNNTEDENIKKIVNILLIYLHNIPANTEYAGQAHDRIDELEKNFIEHEHVNNKTYIPYKINKKII